MNVFIDANILVSVMNKEDGLEYYASLNSICSCIVTEDTNDFCFVSGFVYTAENFLKKYTKPGK